MELSERFDDALVLASSLHRKQTRKASETPYMAHLLGTASVVLEIGGSEDEAIAALLHDSIEDQGDKISLAELESLFGLQVRELIENSMETRSEGQTWLDRKLAYLEKLQHHLDIRDLPSLRVSLADKIHNIWSMVVHPEVHTEAFWLRFNAPKEQQLWVYQQYLGIFAQAFPGMNIITRAQIALNDLAKLAPKVRGTKISDAILS